MVVASDFIVAVWSKLLSFLYGPVVSDSIAILGLLTMSAEYKRVMARCDCIKKVLESLKESPQVVKHAQNQALCLTNVLRGVSLTDDEVADCARRITQIGFPHDIEAQVIESLTEREKVAAPPKMQASFKYAKHKYTQLQNFETFIDYFDMSVWGEMKMSSSTDALKLLVRALLRLGLRHPSCPTFGMMATIFCMMTEGVTATFEKAKADKHKTLEYIKEAFRGFASYHPEPTVYVTVLPYDVSSFVTDYPSLAREFYATAKACAPPFDVPMVKAIAASWPLRKPRSDWGLAAPTERNHEGLMTSFMTTMMRMAQSQGSNRERDPLIRIFEDRKSVTPELERFPLPLENRVSDAIAATAPDTKMNAICDAKPVFDVAKSEPSPVKENPVKEDLQPRDTTASVLEALLARDSQKKKAGAEKRREAAALKRPAASAASSGAKKVKNAIPSLGCSKCRYLANGCAQCRGRRDEALALRKKR